MINNQTSKVLYQGDGVNTHFSVPFDFNEKIEELIIFVKTKIPREDNPNEFKTYEIEVIKAGYSYNETTKELFYPDPSLFDPEHPPVPLTPLQSICIMRKSPFTQLLNAEAQLFKNTDIAKALDKLTKMAQELKEAYKRTVKLNPFFDGHIYYEDFIKILNDLKEEAKYHADRIQNQYEEVIVLTERAETAAENATESAESASESAALAQAVLIGKADKTSIDEPIVKSIAASVASNTAAVRVTNKNLLTEAITVADIPLAIASDTVSGLMPKESLTQLNLNTSDISALKQKRVRYAVRLTSATPSQSELMAAFQAVSGLTTPDDGVTLVDLTYNKDYTWFSSESQWIDRGSAGVSLATNTSPGIVKGADSDGKAYAESDGTLSVVGWDTVKSDIEQNSQNLGNLEHEINIIHSSFVTETKPGGMEGRDYNINIPGYVLAVGDEFTILPHIKSITANATLSINGGTSYRLMRSGSLYANTVNGYPYNVGYFLQLGAPAKYYWNGNVFISSTGSQPFSSDLLGTINPAQLPIATDTLLGVVKQGDNIEIAPDGTISSKGYEFDTGWFSISNNQLYQFTHNLSTYDWEEFLEFRTNDSAYWLRLPVNQYGDANQFNNIILCKTNNENTCAIVTGSNLLHAVYLYNRNTGTRTVVSNIQSGQCRLRLRKIV